MQKMLPDMEELGKAIVVTVEGEVAFEIDSQDYHNNTAMQHAVCLQCIAGMIAAG